MRAGGSEEVAAKALDGARRGPFAELRRRVILTWRYQGPAALAWRIIAVPLRATPLRRLLGAEQQRDAGEARAQRWYAQHGEPVTILITGSSDGEQLRRCVAAIRRTTRAPHVEIAVANVGVDGSEDLGGVELVADDPTLGATARLDWMLRRRSIPRDVILLDGGVTVERNWLAALQHAVRSEAAVAAAGPRILDRHGRLLAAGLAHSRLRGELPPRYCGKPGDFGPALVPVPMLALPPACVYLRRAAIDALGPLDERLAVPDALVEWLERCWQSGFEIRYEPAAVVHQAQSPPPIARPPRAARTVRRPDGSLRIVYVTESTIVGGGHRDVFEHLNRLAGRGHEVSLYTLGERPTWFELDVPVRTFAGYRELVAALSSLEAIKVATWWATAAAVWLASARNGIPVYFVQDIETSYYPDDERSRFRVLASYREEFAYVTISGWNRDRLAEIGLEATLVAPGVNHSTFHPRAQTARRQDMVLAVGRSLPLKQFSLTLAGWRALASPRPELRLFGSEPELASESGVTYERSPSDERVGELFCEAAVFVQTSAHEGFCLPLLEAMASGTPVVCTDAHGNRDFCLDGENCLIVGERAEEVAAAIHRLLRDRELRERLVRGGLETAARYGWEPRIDELERFLAAVAAGVGAVVGGGQ
jgi:glycosyltransferase involved in cell wall biosynthesis